MEELNILAKLEGYKTKSDLVRDLIKEKWDKWAHKVKKYYKEHPEDYIVMDKVVIVEQVFKRRQAYR